MGLDITVATNFKRVLEDVDEWDFYVCQLKDFPIQQGNLKNGEYQSDSGEASYRSSYGTYNSVRNSIAVASGHKSASEVWKKKRGLLHLLINFTDCDGVICNEVCKTIYKELLTIEHKLPLHLVGFDLRCAEDLIAVFKEASEGDGIVIFG